MHKRNSSVSSKSQAKSNPTLSQVFILEYIVCIVLNSMHSHDLHNCITESTPWLLWNTFHEHHNLVLLQKINENPKLHQIRELFRNITRRNAGKRDSLTLTNWPISSGFVANPRSSWAALKTREVSMLSLFNFSFSFLRWTYDATMLR